ncbi:MAG: caspase domain-containing protein [Phreatobacter sp.]
MRNRSSMVALLAALVLTLSTYAASAGQRVALAIGVSTYQDSPLPSPARDAAEMARALADFGFDVTLVQNPDAKAFRAVVDAFIARARGASAAVVYFSGHGLQVNGEVYMMPSDARVDHPDFFSRDEYTVNGIVDRLQAAGVDFKFVIVDACRSNPFVTASGRSALATANAGRAERRMPATNTLISFSSAAGQNAQDWGSSIGLSLYTAALLEVMRASDRIEVSALTRQARALVQDYVARHRAEAQTPWEGSSLMRPIHLERGLPGAVAALPQATPRPDRAEGPQQGSRPAAPGTGLLAQLAEVIALRSAGGPRGAGPVRPVAN